MRTKVGSCLELQIGDIESFLDLGLKITEAKVYIALLELGTAKASAISEVSKVARPDVYRALSNLQELGLVEKIISNPFLFRANPIESAVDILLKQKAKKFTSLEYQSAGLIERFRNKKPNKHFSESDFVLIPSKQPLIKKLCQSIEKTNESIDVFTSCKRLKFACHCLFDELENAWRRNVKGRAIIENNSEPFFDPLFKLWVRERFGFTVPVDGKYNSIDLM